MPTRLFPTTVIGSLPRPAWVRELILDRKAGKISDADTDKLLDRVIDSIVYLQERAGMDELTDGEWRRESYVKVVAERVHGFKPDIHISGDLPYPAAVEKIKYFRPIAADEVRYTRPRTKRRVKVTLPSPYIIGCRMWSPEHSVKAYPKREQLMADCVPILRQEIEACRAAGADTVQLDEPWIGVMVDPNFRKIERMDDPQYEMDLCVDLLNQCVAGITGVETGMHLCHGHFDRQHGASGAYDLIMPALAKLKIGTISMEYATPIAGGHKSLAKFNSTARLGLGCVDHCERRVETPEEIVARVESAMKYVDKSRITLHPDCGFAPSVQNPMDLDEAYLKLKSMCQAAEILRAKHG